MNKFLVICFFFVIWHAEKKRFLNKKHCIGEVAEWSKARAWKACILQKGIAGSNPAFSADSSEIKQTSLNIFHYF